MSLKKQIAVIRESRFQRFKTLWGFANAARVIGAALPAVALTVPKNWVLNTAAPAFVAASCVVVLDLLAKRMQRMAEKAQQLEERWEILGWEPMEDELRNLFLDESSPLSAGEANPYWDARSDSNTAVASIRKVQESAWWTEQLAHSHFVGCAAISVLVIALTLTALLTGATATPTSIAVLAIAAILVIDLPNTTVGYWRLHLECVSMGQTCAHLLAVGKPLKKDQLAKILLEYQLIKSGTPPILQWVYYFRRKKLNAAWEIALRRTGSGNRADSSSTP